MRKIGLRALVLVLALGWASARADVPAFTPNVVDPGNRVSDEDREAINDVIREVKRVGVWAAVYLPDSLDGRTIDAVAHEAFSAWKLGEQGKDNGLLLVLAMSERKTRFEVGYGLEGDYPDALCRHVLDDQVRPRLREGRIKDAVIDALYVLARKRDGSFTLGGRKPPREAASGDTFDARTGAVVWGAWVLFIAWLTFVKKKYTFDNRVVSQVFFSLNPGAFIFIGAGFLGAHWLTVLDAVTDFAWSHVALPPFYLLVALSVAYPIRLYARRAKEAEADLLHGRPALRELEQRWSKVTGERRYPFEGKAPSIVAAFLAVVVVFVIGLVFSIDYREPPAFLVPAGLFLFAMHRGASKLAVFSSAEARTQDLEDKIRRHEEKMNRLVLQGHARRNDDGSFVYTALYYESTASSSDSSSSSDWSSSSSSSDSSSGGGDSGGGGASSDF